MGGRGHNGRKRNDSAVIPECNNKKLTPGSLLIPLKRQTTIKTDGGLATLAWACGGKVLLSLSIDLNVRGWDPSSGTNLYSLPSHNGGHPCLGVSPDGSLFAIPTTAETVGIFLAESGKPLRTFTTGGEGITSIAWTHDNHALAVGFITGGVEVFDLTEGKVGHFLADQRGMIRGLSWAPNRKEFASCSSDDSIKIWGVGNPRPIDQVKGKFGETLAIMWSPSGEIIASGGRDSSIRVWDGKTKALRHVLEGHRREVDSLSWHSSGEFLASSSYDGTVRLWNCKSWGPLATYGTRARFPAFHPNAPLLACAAYSDIHILEFNPDELISAPNQIQSVRYSSAKVILVGDTGVGKTGLWRVLNGEPFAATDSTHGRHVRRFDSVTVELPDGRKEIREIFLWDLAGQPGYRIIHQLHLQEVAIAIVVYDSRSETDPFSGVRHWQRALKQSLSLQKESFWPMKLVLVAARTDRGSIGISSARLESVKNEMGFTADFTTSSREGWGVAALQDFIRNQIAWDKLPRVTSDTIFHDIRTFLSGLRDSGHILLTYDDLLRRFSEKYLSDNPSKKPPLDISDEFAISVRFSEARDLIRHLSFGNLLLLQPEILDAYASAIVDAARKEPDGMGSIKEEDAIAGKYFIPPDERIADVGQEKLLLIATIEDLLRHEIAFREASYDGSHIVFPAQLTRENPDLPDLKGKDSHIDFTGPTLNIYATLAVRLGHSKLFSLASLWKNAAIFTAPQGGQYGIAFTEVEEGRGRITIFFADKTHVALRQQFESFVLSHIGKHSVRNEVRITRIIRCPKCGEGVSEDQIARRTALRKDWVTCVSCDSRISLGAKDEEPSEDSEIQAMGRAADASRDRESAIVSAVAEVKGADFRSWAGASELNLVLVFTDCIGSTQLAEALGDEEMGLLMHRHMNRIKLVTKL